MKLFRLPILLGKEWQPGESEVMVNDEMHPRTDWVWADPRTCKAVKLVGKRGDGARCDGINHALVGMVTDLDSALRVVAKSCDPYEMSLETARTGTPDRYGSLDRTDLTRIADRRRLAVLRSLTPSNMPFETWAPKATPQETAEATPVNIGGILRDILRRCRSSGSQ